MRSLYQTGAGAPEVQGVQALDIAFEKLTGELRLFPGEALAARPFLAVEEFHLRRRIGAGGMGSVYLAWSESLRREVALKVLHADFEGSQRRELLQEARNLAAVRHPNVVQVHQIKSRARWTVVRPPDDPGPRQDGFTDIIVMEYVEGQTLLEWLEPGPSWRAIVDVFVQAARGLAAAHEAGLLHSDVTLRNILVDATDTARLIDFGLSHPSPTQLAPPLRPWHPELKGVEPAGTPATWRPSCSRAASSTPAATSSRCALRCGRRSPERYRTRRTRSRRRPGRPECRRRCRGRRGRAMCRCGYVTS